MNFFWRKHEVQIHPSPLKYKTDTETHKVGDIMPYKWKYIAFCTHPSCIDTLLGNLEFSSMDKANAWLDAHIIENNEVSVYRRVLRRFKGRR